MILKSEYDERRDDIYRIYLEAFPYRIYGFDFSMILDNAYEIMRVWTISVRWIPRYPRDNILSYFAAGGTVWITDINNMELELTQERLAEAIGIILKKYGSKLIDYKKELKTYSFSIALCDEIVQTALYGKKIFNYT